MNTSPKSNSPASGTSCRPTSRWFRGIASVAIAALVPLIGYAQNKVLFIGNSFTEGTGGDGTPAAGGVPGIFDAMAQAGGHLDPVTVMRFEGGEDFEFHDGSTTTQNAITSDQWTHVVLQNYSTEPTHLTPNGGRSVEDHLAFGLSLYDRVIANDPNTEVILYETWSRAAWNPLITGTSTTTSFASTAEFQEELRTNYDLLSDVIDFMRPGNNVTKVAAVGDAMEVAGALLPQADPNYLGLLDAEGYHANDNGYYLAAGVFYGLIYGVSPEGLSTAPQITALGLNLTVPANLLEFTAWAIVSAATEPENQIYVIDFGGENTLNGAPPNDPQFFWNNVTNGIGTSNNGILSDLVTILNTPTSVNLVMLNRFNGVNELGTTSSGIFPQNATRDTLFGNTESFLGLSNVFPSFKLTGLNPTMEYSFTFYASRTGVSDNRETRYTVTGSSTASATLNSVGNIDGSVIVEDIAPDANREITVTITPTVNNNNSVHFTHLGLLRVDAGPSEDNPIVITQHPASKTVNEFGAVSFTASAQGTLPFSIQWTRNGQQIPNANSLKYTINSATSNLSGSTYAVTISNSVNSVTSNSATLTVNPAPTDPFRYLVDFGETPVQTVNGSAPNNDPNFHWNNVTTAIGISNSGVVSNLVTSGNVTTGGSLKIVSRFGGSNGNGTTTSSLFPANATRDTLYGNTEEFQGLSNIFPAFKLDGLNPNWVYHFTFYASRGGATDNRETLYTVEGSTSGSGLLNPSNNVDSSIEVNGIIPNGAGEIQVSLAPSTNNDNANHFTYIGVMAVDAEVIPNPPVINSATTAAGTVDQPFTYTTTATNAPILFEATGLPAGLEIDSDTGVISGTPTAAGTFNVTLTATNYGGSDDENLEITIAKAVATVTLDGLAQTYDGTPKSATVTTNPSDITLNVTYDGGATEPVDAGSYSVTATIVDENYTGSAMGTLEISPATATVLLSNINQNYDGSPRAVTTSTVPSGLPVGVTYDGGATAPTEPGSYAIVATVTDPNYEGSIGGTLTVNKAVATVTLTGLSQPVGNQTEVTVETDPIGLTVEVTYNGSTTPPSTAGSYIVVATVIDDHYVGSVSGTFILTPTSAVISLLNLNVVYNGSPRSPTVQTIPNGLGFEITYDGAATPPTNAGSYLVVATIDDINHVGSTTGTLVIAKAPALVTLSDLSQVFDGSPKSATVTTVPPGLSVAVTYSGNATPPTASGTYEAVATVTDPNYIGSATDLFAIYGIPSITLQPVDKAATIGSSVTFTVDATGSPVPTFQWRKGGINIAGAVGKTLAIDPVGASDAAVYDVVVTNPGGSVTSSPAELEIFDPIVITSEPQDKTIGSGSTTSLSITATGASLTYQWYQGQTGNTSSPVSGATTATFTTPALTTTSSYWVRVMSPAQAVDSRTATVTVNASPRTFFGNFGSEEAGTFGLLVRTDSSGVFLAEVPGTDVCILADEFVVSETGTFTFAIQGLGTVNGQITGNTVTGGVVGGSSLSFSGTQDSPGGPTQSVEGLYDAAIVNTSNGNVFVLAGSNRSAFILVCEDGLPNGGPGVVGPGNRLSGTLTDGTTIDATLVASSGQISGTLVGESGGRPFAGASESALTSKRFHSLSVRAQVSQNDEILIAGFAIKGTGTKRVLIRGVGPTLAQHGVTTALGDPQITLVHHVGTVDTVLNQNDDWGLAPNASEIDTVSEALYAFDLPADSKDSVILVDLAAGRYSALISGVDGQTGTTLVEIYDVDSLSTDPLTTQLASISTRGITGIGDNIVIAGFAVTGNVPKRVLVRAVGPELLPFGVTSALADPVLDLVRQDGPNAGLIVSNDDWGSDAALVSEAGNSVFAFPLTAGSTSSAIVIWLAPGQYTALASSGDGTTGVSLVEMYELP